MIANVSDKTLLEHKTAGYDAGVSAWGYGTLWYYNYRRKPPFRRLHHVPAMLANHRVALCLYILEGAMSSLTHFYVDEDNATIKEFLVNQINRWWRNTASKMIYGALPYGYYGAEVLYRLDADKLMAFDSMKSFKPNDIAPVTHKGALVGIELTDNRGSNVTYIGGNKAFWHVHGREWHPWYGQSVLYGAYEPWLDLVSEGGALDVRRLHYYRNVLQRDVGYYKPGSQPDGSGLIQSNRDLMRQAVEKQRSGGIYTLPSEFDAATGSRLWEIQTMAGGTEGDQVNSYVRDLADEIAQGIGVPPEVLQAAETGSGFSGRKIPEAGFRGILTNKVFWMITDFDEQVLRPLVKRNFGVEPSHEITPFGIVRADEDEEGDQQSTVVPMQGQNAGVPRPSATSGYRAA